MQTKRTSRNGTLRIAKFEALVLVAYQDGTHHSIGFGHNDPSLKPGDTITLKKAFQLLKADILPREARLNRALERDVEQHQFDALMSLHYQSGNRYLVEDPDFPGPFIVDLVNAGELDRAAELLPECNRDAQGVPMKGLRDRRLTEQRLFTTGDYGELSPIKLYRGNPRTTKAELYEVKDSDL